MPIPTGCLSSTNVCILTPAPCAYSHVHPTSLRRPVHIEHGVMIGASTCVGADTKIDHSVIGANCTIGMSYRRHLHSHMIDIETFPKNSTCNYLSGLLPQYGDTCRVIAIYSGVWIPSHLTLFLPVLRRQLFHYQFVHMGQRHHR